MTNFNKLKNWINREYKDKTFKPTDVWDFFKSQEITVAKSYVNNALADLVRYGEIQKIARGIYAGLNYRKSAETLLDKIFGKQGWFWTPESIKQLIGYTQDNNVLSVYATKDVNRTSYAEHFSDLGVKVIAFESVTTQGKQKIGKVIEDPVKKSLFEIFNEYLEMDERYGARIENMALAKDRKINGKKINKEK